MTTMPCTVCNEVRPAVLAILSKKLAVCEACFERIRLGAQVPREVQPLFDGIIPWQAR